MAETRHPSTPRRRRPVPKFFRALCGHRRLLVCGLLGVIVGVALPDQIGQPPRELSYLPIELSATARGLIAWNVAVSLYLWLAARHIARSTHGTIRKDARRADEGRVVALGLATAASCVALGAIVWELGPVKAMTGWEKSAHLMLAIATVLNSWLFMHLTFAFHYAHEYYLERQSAHDKKREERGGLVFPGTATPQYVDFLYFAYVIGVASQTADVSTASPEMRFLALVHGVLSFFFNTSILALTVNIASGFV